MTHMELATYIATANTLLATATAKENDPLDPLMVNIRQALCEAQMYFTKMAFEELAGKVSE